MATTQPYLELTDGVTSVKLMDNTLTTATQIAAMPYRLSYGDWAPNVARRATNPLGLPYMPVLESFTIDIKGATPDQALNRLQTLNTLLDQAERWYNNEIVAPVFIRYQPKGSAKSTYFSDVLIGRGLGNQSDTPILTLPSDFNSVGDFSYIQSIRVAVWRKNGLWLCETESQSVTNVAQPGPLTVTWSDFANILSPVDISFGANSGVGATAHTPSGYVVVTHDNRYIVPIAGTAELSGSGAATADAAHLPTNANIARFTVNPTISGLYAAGSLPTTEVEYFAAFCKVRNNSTTIDAFISGQTTTLLQQEVKIPAAPSAPPLVVFLGIFPTRGRALPAFGATFPTGNFGINLRSAGASITVDVDELLLVGINRATNIVAINNITFPVLTASNGTFMLHRLLNEPQGEIATNQVPNDVLLSYTGSAYNFTGSSATVKKTSLALFAIDLANWNVNTGATKITLDMTATRTKAYLVPE